MTRAFLCLVCFLAILTGCASTGQSVGGTVHAPITIKEPDFLNPEIAPYAPRIYSILSGHGFTVGKTDDPDALRLEINFDPNLFATAIKINLIKPGMGLIVSAEAVNHGWGTGIARAQAIGNLVESASTQFSQQLSTVKFVLASDKNNFVACFKDLAADPELISIRNKVSLSDARDQTFSMLADNTKPNDLEKIALKNWGEKRDNCMRMRRANMASRNIPLAIANVLDSSDAAGQALLVELLNGRLTYAAYAKRRHDLVTFTNDTLASIETELQKQTEESRFKASQMAIEAQRNALMQQKILSDQEQQQQQLNVQQQELNVQRLNANRPRTTNCTAAGQTIACATW